MIPEDQEPTSKSLPAGPESAGIENTGTNTTNMTPSQPQQTNPGIIPNQIAPAAINVAKTGSKLWLWWSIGAAIVLVGIIGTVYLINVNSNNNSAKSVQTDAGSTSSDVNTTKPSRQLTEREEINRATLTSDGVKLEWVLYKLGDSWEKNEGASYVGYGVVTNQSSITLRHYIKYSNGSEELSNIGMSNGTSADGAWIPPGGFISIYVSNIDPVKPVSISAESVAGVSPDGDRKIDLIDATLTEQQKTDNTVDLSGSFPIPKSTNEYGENGSVHIALLGSKGEIVCACSETVSASKKDVNFNFTVPCFGISAGQWTNSKTNLVLDARTYPSS